LIHVEQFICNKWLNCYCVLSCSLQSLCSFNTETRAMYYNRMSWYWKKKYVART